MKHYYLNVTFLKCSFSFQLTIENPFSFESYGSCGVQFISPEEFGPTIPIQNENRKTFAHPKWLRQRKNVNQMAKVVKGGDAYRGQVPWQALISIYFSPQGKVHKKTCFH